MTERENDAEVARRIMGWRHEKYSNGGGFWHRKPVCKRKPFTESCECGGSWVLPHYSTDPTASARLRAKLAEIGFWFSASYKIGVFQEEFQKPGYEVILRDTEGKYNHHDWFGIAETLEEGLVACCLKIPEVRNATI